MNEIHRILSGQESPDLDYTSSGDETTIFSPKFPSHCYHGRNRSMDSKPRDVTREHADANDYKNVTCFSARSQEYCTNFYESIKMRKIPDYDNTVHLKEQQILAAKIEGRHNHDSCISAQRPLKRYCEKEMCPMIVFRDKFFTELFEAPPRLSSEKFETTPRYSAIQSGKFLFTAGIRNAFSKIEILFGTKETRSMKHYREVRNRSKRYFALLYGFKRAPSDDSYSDEELEDAMCEYRKTLSDFQDQAPKDS